MICKFDTSKNDENILEKTSLYLFHFIFDLTETFIIFP